MGFYVHLSVIFACDRNDGVAELAKKHRALLPAEDSSELHGGIREAGWFLDDLSARTGGNKGPKGGLSLWGTVGNYTLGAHFVEALRPFWTELLGVGVEGGPCSFERVIVFDEPEQSEAANCHEIWWNEDEEKLHVRHHERLPFAWMQF